MPIITFFLFIIYAFLVGVYDAILYSGKKYKAFEWNEHIVGNLINFIVLCLFVSGLFYEAKYIETILADIFVISISISLAYSFIHNGFYYETRRLIDVPEYRFTTNNIDSTANINLSFKWRLVGFIAGLILVIIWTIFR